MEIISIVIAVISAIFSIVTYIKSVRYEKRKSTIEAFHFLQNEVLDYFVNITNENAKLIVDNLDNMKCKEAYDDQRALIARLEHFAVGVKKRIYDFDVVDNLAGIHLITLYKKIKPIIDEANRKEKKVNHYYHFCELVKKLDEKHKILKEKNE